MTTDERAILDRFLGDIEMMIVNRMPAGESKKKPLLLLLLLSDLRHNKVRENRVLFADVEERLSRLIIEFGGRPADHGAKPEQPFFHLRTSPFWKLSVPGSLPENNKKTPSRRVLADPAAFACLPDDLFALLRSSEEARKDAINAILHRWWSGDEAVRLQSTLHL